MSRTSDWWSRRLSLTPSDHHPSAPPPGAPTALPPPPLSGPPAPDGAIAVLARAAEQTGGSTRVKESTGRCPECGSGNYFSRKYNEQGMALRLEPAPRCYDCGFPLIQAGSSHGSAAGMRSSGPTRAARQLPSNHAVTVVADGGTMTFPAR